MKRILLFSVVAAAFAGAGCETEVRTAPVAVGVEYDAGPDNVYYQRGTYVGSDWVWHDNAGKEFHEARAVHEQRAARPQKAPEHRAEAKPAEGKPAEHEHDADRR